MSIKVEKITAEEFDRIGQFSDAAKVASVSTKPTDNPFLLPPLVPPTAINLQPVDTGIRRQGVPFTSHFAIAAMLEKYGL